MNETSKSTGAIAHAVSNLVGGQGRLNYFTHLDEDLGFVYLATPVVANVRTIGSLNLAVAQATGEQFEYESIAQIYNRQNSIVANPKMIGMKAFDQMLEDPGVIKFTFVRDPVERFAATYRTSFSMNLKGGMQRKRLFEFLGIAEEENLSMLDLAELVCEEEELKSLLPQLRSQRNMTAFDLMDYSFIGRHENWEEDFSCVSEEIFGRVVPRFDPVEVFNKDPEGIEIINIVEDEVIEAVKLAYVEDFEMLREIEESYPKGFSQEN